MLVAEGYEALAAVAAATPERAVAEVPLLEMLPGGSVLIRKELYGEPEVIVDQPWAKDATGRPLPTKYLVKGDRLIQTIDVPGDATFPVVADPKLRKYWWGISYDFNKTETKKIAAGGTICAGVFAAAAALVTGPAGPIIAGACGVAAGVASWADAQGKCVSVRVLYVPGSAVPWIRTC